MPDPFTFFLSGPLQFVLATKSSGAELGSSSAMLEFYNAMPRCSSAGFYGAKPGFSDAIPKSSNAMSESSDIVFSGAMSGSSGI